MKINTNHKYLIILLGIIALAFVLRFYHLTKHPLWNDEAETSLNALQVLEVGYPHGYFRGEPMYENFLWLKSNSAKYQYEEVNYQGSIYEKNKGWLPYYYLALWFKLFGTTTLIARLPFVLISLLNVVFIFLLGRELFSKNAGLLASLFYALNPLLIINERQARYYSFFILLILATLYFYQKILSLNQKKYYWFLTISLILLFYTHIIAWFIASLFIIAHWLIMRKGKVTPPCLISSLVLLAAILPWVFFVEFWTVISYSISGELKLIWLLFLVAVFTGYFIFKTVAQVLFKVKTKLSLFKISLISQFIIFYIIMVPFLIPEASFAVRVFLPAIALLSISLAAAWLKFIKSKKLMRIIPVALLIFVFAESYIYFSGDNNVYYSDWLNDAFNYLEEQKLNLTTPVYVGSQQHAFLFYTPYAVQTVQVLKKEYLDNYPGELYLVLDYLKDYCMIKDRRLCQDGFLNYRDRIKTCDPKILNNELLIYHCPAVN